MKRELLGLILTGIACLARPMGGFGLVIDLVYAVFFAFGVYLLITADSSVTRHGISESCRNKTRSRKITSGL